MKKMPIVRGCLALVLAVACSGTGNEEADPGSGDQVAAVTCQNCEPKVVCRDHFEPCNPPVEVNGRNVTCLVTECKEELVCTPCGGGGDLASDLDGLPDLDFDDFPPFDPSPFSR